jgi:hypothetical protein
MPDEHLTPTKRIYSIRGIGVQAVIWIGKNRHLSSRTAGVRGLCTTRKGLTFASTSLYHQHSRFLITLSGVAFNIESAMLQVLSYHLAIRFFVHSMCIVRTCAVVTIWMRCSLSCTWFVPRPWQVTETAKSESARTMVANSLFICFSP